MPNPNRFSSPGFYDRQWEQRNLQSLLQQDNNILITAPRRVGKTELCYKLLDWAADQGWLPAYANVEEAQNEADFFEELVRAVSEAGVRPKFLDQLKNARDNLRKHLPSKAKLSDGENSVEFELTPPAEEALRETQEKLSQLLESLTASDKTLLIGLDELPIFLTTLCHQPSGETRAKTMLHWFRKLRTSPSLSRVRWLLCGSIGLDTFVEQRSLAGSINDLRPEKLGPFEDSIAIEFVKLRARLGIEPLDIDDKMAKSVVSLVGWPLPFYLKLMVEELQGLPPPYRSAAYPSEPDLDTAYAKLVSIDKKVQFMHWVGRLDLQFGKKASRIVRAILKQCCQKPEGSTHPRLRNLMIRHYQGEDTDWINRELTRILGILERDGYLHNEGARWAFRSFLLRDFWQRHVPC